MVISGELNSSLELVILVIIVKNTTFIASTAVQHDSGAVRAHSVRCQSHYNIIEQAS